MGKPALIGDWKSVNCEGMTLRLTSSRWYHRFPHEGGTRVNHGAITSYDMDKGRMTVRLSRNKVVLDVTWRVLTDGPRPIMYMNMGGRSSDIIYVQKEDGKK